MLCAAHTPVRLIWSPRLPLTFVGVFADEEQTAA